MKKKVLIFIEDGSYSYDNRVKHMANSLIKEGWQVSVISPKYKEDLLAYKSSNGIYCYHYPKITAESFWGHVIEHTISLILGTMLTCWVAIRRGFHVFHACNPTDILWLIALPHKIFKKAFIFDQHDLSPELYLSRGEGGTNSIAYRLLIGLEKWSYQYADSIISTNESYRRIALSRGGVSGSRVFVVRNGPDLEKFIPRKTEYNIANEYEILVGYLGNMNEQDGVGLLVDAAKYIIYKKKKKNIRFAIIGGGSSLEKLKDHVNNHNLEKYITITGRLSDEKMLDILNACDVCVQPDPLNPLNDVSTMNKVMEYMALKKPVVAFDLQETRVSCQNAAVYAKPNKIEDLAEKIMSLSENDKLRKNMGEIGRKRVEDVLAWKYSEKNLISAYNYAYNNTK